MRNMIRDLKARRAAGDEGFTLIELLVVVIIIGILAAIAIPVFLNQKAKAYDASVKSDLKSFATDAETFFADNNNYGTVTGPPVGEQFSSDGNSTPIKSAGNNFKAFLVTGAQAGYIIYGQNTGSATVWVLSSLNGSSPTATALTALPTTAPAAGTLGIAATGSSVSAAFGW